MDNSRFQNRYEIAPLGKNQVIATDGKVEITANNLGDTIQGLTQVNPKVANILREPRRVELEQKDQFSRDGSGRITSRTYRVKLYT